MKPFLILQLRPNDEASQGEYEAMLKFGKLKPEETIRIRMEQAGVPDINLDDYSGIIIGGGPSDVSNSEEKKSEAQKKFEADLKKLWPKIIKRDFPTLGCCYGLGSLATNLGCTVSKEKYSEEVGAVDIILNEEGKKDKLLEGVPDIFRAFLGHKEACQHVPKEATLLASSPTCPVHLIRLKENIYATQFHPELDIEGIILRINIYKNAGYFPPEDAGKLIEKCRAEKKVPYPGKILENFVKIYKK